ncbi:MAG TPA: response regulator [Candidatus Limnocylindria bacterium]|jgi:DNA-binding NarL/FixJ family response regulator/class 3 adenylate cyclase
MQRTEAPLRQLTFLFADVEGSTRIAERHGATAGAALARYHELVGTVAAAHGGRIFERIGDGAYASFPDAAEAVAAAAELQLAVAEEDWGSIGRLRIRIALVSGEVEVRGDRYYGRPLFRAARLQALANGGETLLAGSTADGLDTPPDGTILRDLGAQRLRDVTEPERVFALVHTSRARSSELPEADASDMQGTDTVTDEDGPIRVLLVDDHAVVRRGLRGFLELLKDFDVVGEAENGRDGVTAADRLAPDVILMDLLMPEMGGLEAIGLIKSAHPEIEIVAVTSFIEEEKVTAALEAGASGYLLKDAEAEEVAQAIRAAYNGEVHLDPAVSRLLAQRLRQRKDAEPVEPLTAREKEVLSQLARGAANKEIAYELGITERTARTHVSNILGKLGLASRTQAALYAVEHKLV